MAAAPPSFVSKPTRGWLHPDHLFLFCGILTRSFFKSCSLTMIQFSKGWLHPDHLFARDGINYAVRYQKLCCQVSKDLCWQVSAIHLANNHQLSAHD